MNRRFTTGDRAGSTLRIYLGGNTFVTWMMPGFDPILVWLLMFCGVAVIMDAVINDLLPYQFHWRFALHQRHFLLVVLAFCYVAQTYVSFLKGFSGAILMYYLWHAAVSMFVTFMDAKQRSRDATCSTIYG